MNETIARRLSEIEATTGFEVLYACESGSRAWGFASPDSDYDVRFIYRYPERRYLSLSPPEQDFILMENDEYDLDFHGWDIRKALGLLNKMNPSLVEWLHSPIVYMDRQGVADTLRSFLAVNYEPMTGQYHYGSLARAAWKSNLVNTDVVPIKKLLYGLRACSAFLWVGENRTPPPVAFARLLDFIEIERPDIGRKCRDVVEVKSGKMEADDIAFDAGLKSWMAETMLQSQEVTGSPDYPSPDRLDAILMRILDSKADRSCLDRSLRP